MKKSDSSSIIDYLGKKIDHFFQPMNGLELTMKKGCVGTNLFGNFQVCQKLSLLPLLNEHGWW